ncbi:hypothetical protein NUU61_005622 [Penicillium alfredii]|uniref:Uncharacterized protein n=1 Tax=Penicillium alfredii TaxID=1506179 RepID=A0A9W9F9X2_9EURO|nr:uncharacterized protein NUU61_005622 [Penicillium alfredii]KAJ5096266.1 hypothetical protein NUU61_005622 [Penicillium alfredii]
MARTDLSFVHEPALPISQSRASSDFGTQSRTKSSVLPTARPGVKGRRTTSYDPHSLVHPPLDLDASPDPSSTSHDPPKFLNNRGSMTSTKAMPDAILSEQPWNSDSHQLVAASSLNTSSDGVDYRPQKSKSGKPKVHIKPMLRKMSRDDAPSTSIDLSRSSTEQEGLGIYMNFDRDRRQSESLTGVAFKPTTPGLHHRSTSGASHFSTATGSSISKPGSQYVHPMRQTPRAYTPPLSQSYSTSVHDSDELEDGTPETEPRTLPRSEIQPSFVRASSGPVPRLSLHIEDDSFTHLPGISQTNVSGRPSLSCSRDNGTGLETASPISRSSLDFVFRSRTRTSTDPISRAATVQAARQAFEEKEAAKTRRLEQQQTKAEARQTRGRVRRTVSGSPQSPGGHSSEVMSEKPGKSREPHSSEPRDSQQSASWKSQSRSTWVLFMTWLRTRVFKLRRRIRRLY